MKEVQREFEEKTRSRRSNCESTLTAQERSVSGTLTFNLKAGVESNGSESERLKTKIDELRQKLEKSTNQQNSALSASQKQRQEIDSLRKERTLCDHVFKNLEYQILKEEKTLLDTLKKDQELCVLLKESDETLTHILETVDKNKYEDFLNIIQEEKHKYDVQIKNASRINKESIRFDVAHPDMLKDFCNMSERSTSQNPLAQFMRSASKKRLAGTEKTRQLACSIKERQVCLIEDVIQDLKYKAEENDLDICNNFAENGDEINEALYAEFMEDEREVK